MTIRFSIFLMVTALSLTLPGTRAQENLLSIQNALAIARTINTAEIEFRVRDKHAVDLQTLWPHGFMKQLESRMEIEWGADVNSFSAQGYDVRLALTNDQTQYTLTILPKPEQWKSGACPPVFVTNESGIIFHGSAIDCPTTNDRE